MNIKLNTLLSRRLEPGRLFHATLQSVLYFGFITILFVIDTALIVKAIGRLRRIFIDADRWAPAFLFSVSSIAKAGVIFVQLPR